VLVSIQGYFRRLTGQFGAFLVLRERNIRRRLPDLHINMN
jgi:hypothetical protein